MTTPAAAPPGRRLVVQGHRGFRAAWPENTLAGFEAALRAGADAIEVDVGLTRDGVVVVCHDPRLDPDLTRGPDGAWIAPPGPLLRAHGLAALRAHDVGRARPGGPTATAFPEQRAVDGARVPTLAEVFALAAGFAAIVDVELKTDPTAPGLTPEPAELAEAVMAVAIAGGGRDRLALRSFDWRGLDHAAARWPEVGLTWLSDAETEGRADWHGGRAGPTPECLAGPAAAMPGRVTWAPDHRGLTRGLTERARALGLRVVPWTVNTPEAVARLLAWGVDGVCTDDVAMALKVVGAMA
jgi:glycerophosphoryl diester phosphodiesterase